MDINQLKTTNSQLKRQVAYYKALSGGERHIVNLCIFAYPNFNAWSITRVCDPEFHITEPFVAQVIKNCAKEKIIIKAGYVTVVDIDFMVAIYPMIRTRKTGLPQFYYSYYEYENKLISDYLYALFYDKEDIKNLEGKIFKLKESVLRSLFALFEVDSYQKVLPLVAPFLQNKIFYAKLSSHIKNLEPWSTFEGTNSWEEPAFKSLMSLLQGDFETSNKEAAKQTNDEYSVFFASASQQFLKEDNPEEAFILFEKGIKKQRSTFPNTFLPPWPLLTIYYFSILLKLGAARYSHIMQKNILSLNKKKQNDIYDYLYLTICHYSLNEKEIAKNLQKRLIDKFERYEATLDEDIWIIIALYLTDYKDFTNIIRTAFGIVANVYKNGYSAPALEAAYVLKQWESTLGSTHGSTHESEKLYHTIRQKIGFDAALSKFEKKEEWEVSLEMISQIASTKQSTEKKPDVQSRVVYYIDPSKNIVQPVMQIAKAKGGWNKGKNVSSKALRIKADEGMTDLDLRVGQCVHSYNGKYEIGLHSFQTTVYKELIGHPNLFLYGSADVPVELVEGIPEITVVEAKGGYQLTSNLKKLEHIYDVFVLKETNTRYKVFALTDEQQQILHIIWSQDLLIPEKGKNKLLEVVGKFSSAMTVHSDVTATDTSLANTVSATLVEPDSRIRVQLLPWGTGLKAELFAKPFGAHPPYCKPGVGGKMLFYNLQGNPLRVNRELEKELAYFNTLLGEIQTLESIYVNEDLMSFEHPQDSLFLLEVLEKHKDIAVVEWPEGERFKLTKALDFSALQLRLKGHNDWFELQGEIQIDEHTILTIKELLELSKQAHGRFVEMQSGAFLALSKRLKQQLDNLNTVAQAHKKEVQINRFAMMSMTDFWDEVEGLKVDKAWKEMRKKMKDSDKIDVVVPAGLQAELRPYQMDGFRWMMRLSAWGAGACLADDMGLGKTIQAICMLLSRSTEGAQLVIAPVSVIPNWVNELRKFAPGLNPLVLATTKRKKMMEDLQAGDVLIASYGILQSEEGLFTNREWKTVVLDEAHTIKNFATKTSKAAMSLQADFKLILTGTPIQNHLGEIWNLFHFINPGMLGSLSQFAERFIKPEAEEGKKLLKRLIAPFILRRTKTAVLEELPPKTEIVKKIHLSDEETAFYEAVRQQAIEALEREESATKHIKVLAEITRLRQASCNPRLVNSDIKIPSSKLSIFLEIVQDLQENKHRALVFSQFVTHLSLVKEALDEQKISYLYLDGSTPMSDRERLVKRFQAGECDLFLISLKAGGLGLNLTGADFVVHLDPWWNPAIEDQASDRAHRIGQTRPVTVYRLVAENTIEEKIIKLHHTKRDLADSLLEGSDMVANLSAKELLNLIKE
ncbi:SWF/SNF family helicase [Bacteroidia bacterium]|nr:SWF/SNF family helicase [Bacteroidia bacterium]